MCQYSFDAEYDVVVIGGGAAGKMAAYTGAKEGSLKVALLEKMEKTGGTSAYAEGQAAFNSIEQRERKVPPIPGMHYPTYAEGYARYMDFSHQRANPEVVRMQLYNTAETIEFMRSLGIKYTDVTIYAYDQLYELNTFHRPEGLGEHMQEVLLRATINAGVDVFTSTPAQRILMDGDRIVGVEAQDAKGNKMTIGCQAVVIATGGFGNSAEMIKKYSWQSYVADYNYSCIPTQNTGDGLRMALEAGADTASLGALMIQPCARGKTFTSHTNGAGSQPVLWVNKTGRRFVNEQVAFSFMDHGANIAKQPEGIVYAILDAEQVKYYMEQGSEIGLGDWLMYQEKLSKLQLELDQDVADGVAWRGNTIEELAKAIGNIDACAFVAEVAEYNKFCETGEDTMFFKDKKYLRPLKTGPFYAINMAPSVLVSCGGIRVNGNLQVTDKDYTPIPGLYAVGMEASGLYGDTYNLDVPGTANGFAHASGRVAARHIIKTLKG